MKTLKDIKQTLKERLLEIKEKYYVKNLYIFGSYVREEQPQNSFRKDRFKINICNR